MLDFLQQLHTQWDPQLSMNLAIRGSLSIALAHDLSAIAMYAFGAPVYPTVLCLFYHQMWVGGFLIIGAGGHASNCVIGSKTITQAANTCLLSPVVLGKDTTPLDQDPNPRPLGNSSYSCLIRMNWHRDSIIGHLIWVSIALGLHGFSLYLHNDTLEGFRRPEDMFDESCIQLKPVFGNQTHTHKFAIVHRVLA